MTCWYLTRGPDGELARVEAVDFGPRERFALDLFFRMPSRYLELRKGGTIVVNADNGRWVYRVVDYDPDTRVLTGVWPD